MNKSETHHKVKVRCITTGEIFESAYEAAKFYNIPSNSGIVKCCKGIRTHAGKLSDGTPLEWEYANEELRNKFKDIKESLSNKKVRCINTGEIFASTSIAAKKYNLTSNSIYECCSYKRRYSGSLEDGTKLEWEYADEELRKKYMENKEKLNSKKKSKDKLKIRCITTGEIFESAYEAAKFYNIASNSGILKCCKGIRIYAGKLSDGTRLEWEYANEELREKYSDIKKELKSTCKIKENVNYSKNPIKRKEKSNNTSNIKVISNKKSNIKEKSKPKRSNKRKYKVDDSNIVFAPHGIYVKERFLHFTHIKKLRKISEEQLINQNRKEKLYYGSSSY